MHTPPLTSSYIRKAATACFSSRSTAPHVSARDPRRYSVAGARYSTEGVALPGANVDGGFLLRIASGITALFSVYRPTVEEIEWIQREGQAASDLPYTPNTRHLTVALLKPGVDEGQLLSTFGGAAVMPDVSDALLAALTDDDAVESPALVEQLVRHALATGAAGFTRLTVVRHEGSDEYLGRAYLQTLAWAVTADWWPEGAWLAPQPFAELMLLLDHPAVLGAMELARRTETAADHGTLSDILGEVIKGGMLHFLSGKIEQRLTMKAVGIHAEGEDEDEHEGGAASGPFTAPLGATTPSVVS